MSPLEAMNKLIVVARTYVDNHCGAELGCGLTEAELADEAEIKEAVVKTEAMLGAAIPLTRFRVFVEVSSFVKQKKVQAEFVICAVSIEAVRIGIDALRYHRGDVLIKIFEQKQTGPDMVSGFQGP